MNLAEIRRRRGELRDANRALVAAARTAGRDLTDEERSQFDERMAQIERLSADEARAIAFEEDEQRSGRPQNPPSPGNPNENPGNDQRFGSFGEFLRSVAIADRTGGRQMDRRLTLVEERAASGANETVPSDGGYLVGQDTSATLLTRVTETGILFPQAQRIPLSGSSNGMKINGIDETSRAEGSQWGGVRVYRAAEADAFTASRPKFRRIELSLKKAIGLCYATDELLEDAAALEAVIMQAFPNAFGWKFDNEFVRGDGAAGMLGVLNCPALVTIAKETGQASATLLYDNVVKMFSRLWAPSMPRAKWYINQDVYPQLLTLAQIIGTGGVPVFLPPGVASEAPFGTLLGRPVQPIEQCSTLGTVGDIILMDPTQYVMIEKGGMQSASSIHVRFLNDEQVFRFTVRNDGEPTWSTTLTPSNGTNTVSPFVALATR